MEEHPWFAEFPGSILVCDPEGIILEMNDKAARAYAADGGRQLIGANLLDCHPEPARSKVRGMLASRSPNIYTIEKNDQHKLIYQVPWLAGGVYRGFIELTLEIPVEMPHFVRG